MLRFLSVATSILLTLASTACIAQANPETLAAQRKAVAELSRYDGLWRGEAIIVNPEGTKLTLIQTERVGPFLDGTLRLIEGRGFAPDGTVVFGALAVVSYAPQTGKYNFRSYAEGFAGDYPLEVRSDGFTWSLNAGGAVIRYTSTVIGDTWTEVGERIVRDQPPIRIFEMRLRRIGPTDWPAAGAVPRAQ